MEGLAWITYISD